MSLQDRRSNEHIGHSKFLRQDARSFDFARVMPAADELSDKDAACLMSEALAVVKDNFAPEHLPKCVHDYLLPISVASCQGLFSTTMMFAAAMPALTSGDTAVV